MPFHKCESKNIHDFPTDNDAFWGHEKVSKSIYNMIINRPGGYAIGLIGKWGSGKSTIVNILNRIITREGKAAELDVFVYDAWEHQGDLYTFCDPL